MKPGTALTRTVLFIAFGLCTEIVFTGVSAGFGGNFRGEVSLLMIPVYALAWAVLGPGLALLKRLGFDGAAVRLPLTVVAIYAIEWAFGAAYATAGLWPWHYEHGWASDFSNGHITLLYAPFWLVFAAVLPKVRELILGLTGPR